LKSPEEKALSPYNGAELGEYGMDMEKLSPETRLKEYEQRARDKHWAYASAIIGITAIVAGFSIEDLSSMVILGIILIIISVIFYGWSESNRLKALALEDQIRQSKNQIYQSFRPEALESIPSSTVMPSQPSKKIVEEFCRHCGQRIPFDSTFCKHCGKEL